jgi:hypothetical protein
MLTAETRIINKCTYTPVVNDPAVGDDRPEFVPRRGLAKVGLLATVLDGSAISRHVLAEVCRQAGERGLREVDALVAAVEELWRDDPQAAARILGGVDVDDVARFAETVVVAEDEMVRDARVDLEESVSAALAQAVHDESDVRAEVRRQTEVAEADVREPFVAPFRLREPRPVSTVVERTGPGLGGLEPGELLAVLRERSPMSAAVFDAIGGGAFTPMLAGTYGGFGGLVVPFVLHGYVTQQKAKTVRSLVEGLKVEPLGFLHLERLQFTPVGYVRGELVYSLPMAPGEVVRLNHREWTRTEQEFEKLVATSLETASEESLGEKSELTESFNSQQQHNSAFNASVTASGGFGPVQITTSVGYNASNASSQSRQSSSQHSQEITKKASSRAKSEHKVTFKVTSVHELEETSFREIANTLERPVRWDFHRLMRKWRIDLYRYDMRMTYDIVVPEPASYLLRKHIQLRMLEQTLAQPFVMPIQAAEISRGSPGSTGPSDWVVLSGVYGVSLPPPPPPERPADGGKAEVKFVKQQNGDGFVKITLPEGYEFATWQGHDRNYSQMRDDDGNTWPFDYGSIDALNQENSDRLQGKFGKSNTYDWRYLYHWNSANPEGYTIEPDTTMNVAVEAVGRLTEDAFREWQMRCYELLSDAARMRYEERRDLLEKMRDDLVEELGREDALMLRKLEKEEIMKAVLRWLLGPDFRFYPQHLLDLPNLTLDPNGYLQYYEKGASPFEPGTENVREAYHEPALKHGEIVKFLHHAIEWENVNYVLYPYFWTDEPRWDFKQSLFHSDYVHRGFLRAGSARVVLTIRPGFEGPFLEWVEGFPQGVMPADYPYQTIADEVEQLAKTSYPYTQDANAEMERVLCRWDQVPGPGTAHLLHFLEEDLNLGWAADAQVEKDADDKILFIRAGHVRASAERVEINLDEAAAKAVLSVSPSRVYDLSVRRDDDGLKLLFQPNWVDTWYEFTPTGALDIAEGQVLP